MHALNLAPPSTATAWTLTTTPGSTSEAACATTQRVSAEIDQLWSLTERLSSLVAHPGAALELVTRTAGELTQADAAAVLLQTGCGVVLASRWGIVGVPIGYKCTNVRRTLDASWAATASMPIRSGAHEIGCLWIARANPAFSADDQRVLRTLASVTSLALPMLLDGGRASSAAHDAAPARAGSPEAPHPAERLDSARLDRNRMDPMTMRLSVFPPSLARLLRTIDAGEEVGAIAAVVDTDPVLSALVIRAGNCAAAARAPARSVRESILFLGMQRVRTLALATFTRKLVAGAQPLDAWLWEQAIGTAVRTHALLLAGDHHLDAEAGRLAGLLHPMGSIALATSHPERYARTLRTALGDDRPLAEVERETFGIDSATLTQQLLRAWHLGPALAPSHRGEAEGVMHAAVSLATHVTLATNPEGPRTVGTEPGQAPSWVEVAIADAVRALGLDAATVDAVGAESERALEETRRLLAD
jgi:HD-like signal output (HDOD) protein